MHSNCRLDDLGQLPLPHRSCGVSQRQDVHEKPLVRALLLLYHAQGRAASSAAHCRSGDRRDRVQVRLRARQNEMCFEKSVARAARPMRRSRVSMGRSHDVAWRSSSAPSIQSLPRWGGMSTARHSQKSEPCPTRLRDTTTCLLYTSPSPRDQRGSRMPSSA